MECYGLVCHGNGDRGALAVGRMLTMHVFSSAYGACVETGSVVEEIVEKVEGRLEGQIKARPAVTRNACGA